MSLIKWVSFAISAALLVSGCASTKMKERKEQREKVALASKLFCEYINGEIYPDIDVALNIEMAKRCDSEKHFSITQYKTPTENQGIMYCCATSASRMMDKNSKKETKAKDSAKDAAKDEIE